MTNHDVQAGPRERHLLRRRNNPLFPKQQRSVNEGELAQAMLDDELQRRAFREHFETLVQRAIGLKPNESSDSILELKAELDRAYVEGVALGGDNKERLNAIQRLVEVTMQAVRAAAGPDPVALQELRDEEMARQANYALLQYPLVADLMLPNSPVPPEELVPTLLSEEAPAVDAALWLFEREQVASLAGEARTLLSALEEQGVRPAGAWDRLTQLEAAAGGHSELN